MGEMITKPDANPIVLALANLFLLGAGGYFLMGQQKKAMITAAIWLVGMFCTFGFLCLIAWVTAYDAYLLGQKLAQGESIGEVENGLDALNMIFK